jgi:hypothetical protein
MRAVLVLLGLRRRRKTVLNTQPLDIIVMVAKLLWATRRAEDWQL